jgi:hypothetical protein
MRPGELLGRQDFDEMRPVIDPLFQLIRLMMICGIGSPLFKSARALCPIEPSRQSSNG